MKLTDHRKYATAVRLVLVLSLTVGFGHKSWNAAKISSCVLGMLVPSVS